jgi:hypothetical protein
MPRPSDLAAAIRRLVAKALAADNAGEELRSAVLYLDASRQCATTAWLNADDALRAEIVPIQNQLTEILDRARERIACPS